MSHNDSIVYEDSDFVELNHFNNYHKEEHIPHQNDSKDDKNRKHHHHCSVEVNSIVGIAHLLNRYIIKIFFKKKNIYNFYKNIYNSSYLFGFFHPPKFYQFN